MARFQHKQASRTKHHMLWSILIFAVVLLIFTRALTSFSDGDDKRQADNLEKALRSGITYCYAMEGTYPESLDYLKENYGIAYDDTRFFVDYRITAANLYPDITIIPLEQGGAS